jgi:restriction endonuclease Mrr
MRGVDEFWLGYQPEHPHEAKLLACVRDELVQARKSGSLLAAVHQQISRLRGEEDDAYGEWWERKLDETRLNALATIQEDFERLHQARAEVEDASARMAIWGRIRVQLQQLDTQEERSRLRVVLQECNAELVRWLAAHPEELYTVHPGTFENIVAWIFARQGFEVVPISSWNQADGGVDLLAVMKIVDGLDFRVAVQCKRYARDRKVSAETIRALKGVLDMTKADRGVLATTSFFAPSAEELVRQHLWQISLRDYDRIVADLISLSLIGKSKHAV